MNFILMLACLTCFFVIFGNKGNKRLNHLLKQNFSKNIFKDRKIDTNLPVEWLDELVANLQSGAPARAALKNSIKNLSLPFTETACANGTSVSQALVLDRPNDSVAKALSSCWDISEEAGAPLTAAIGQLAKSLQIKIQLEQELHSALTQSKLSVWVLAGLPVFGLFLAGAVGDNPLVWLFGSNLGLTVLTLGLMMELLGIFWVKRITSSVSKYL